MRERGLGPFWRFFRYLDEVLAPSESLSLPTFNFNREKRSGYSTTSLTRSASNYVRGVCYVNLRSRWNT